jgi:nicotinamidase-related amidase
MMPYLKQKIENFTGEIVFTQDTHDQDYLLSIEGKKLPIPHCLKGTYGWKLYHDIEPFSRGRKIFEKHTFGSEALIAYLKTLSKTSTIASITCVGICTDICVITNVMLIKTAFPNILITVDAQACAGVTPQSHQQALAAMKIVHIDII